MAGVDSSGAEAKAKRMLDNLRDKIVTELPRVAINLQMAVAAAAPTHEEEYATLMLGDGQRDGYTLVPLAGDQSADPDNRTRFSKDAGTWIADVVVSDLNRHVFSDDEMATVAIGDLELHEAAAMFSYTDEDQSESLVGPYFEAFEFGSASTGWNETVVPKGVTTGGKPYPLRPDEDPTHRPFSMYKPILSRRMYGASALESVAREVLDKIMSEIESGEI